LKKKLTLEFDFQLLLEQVKTFDSKFAVEADI
jgi:hypothetical protein